MRGEKLVIRWSAVLVVVAHLSAAIAVAVPGDVNLDVDPLYQTDYTAKIDNSDRTIAQDGCSLTALTMEINFYLKKHGVMTMDAGGAKKLLQYTPEDVNTLLNDFRYTQREFKIGPDGKTEKGPDGKAIVTGTTTRNGWGVPIGADGMPMGSSLVVNAGAMIRAVTADSKAKDCAGAGITLSAFTDSGYGTTPPLPEPCTTLDKDFLAVLELLEGGRPVPVRVANDTHTVLITSFHQTEGAARGVGRYDIKDPIKTAGGTSILWLDDAAYSNMIYAYRSAAYKPGGPGQPPPQQFVLPSDAFIPLDLLLDPFENPDFLGPQNMLANSPRVLGAEDVPEPGCITLVTMAGLLGAMRRRGRARGAFATMSPA